MRYAVIGINRGIIVGMACVAAVGTFFLVLHHARATEDGIYFAD